MRLFIHSTFRDPFEAWQSFRRNGKLINCEITDNKIYIYPIAEIENKLLENDFYEIDSDYVMPI